TDGGAADHGTASSRDGEGDGGVRYGITEGVFDDDGGSRGDGGADGRVLVVAGRGGERGRVARGRVSGERDGGGAPPGSGRCRGVYRGMRGERPGAHGGHAVGVGRRRAARHGAAAGECYGDPGPGIAESVGDEDRRTGDDSRSDRRDLVIAAVELEQW